MKLLKLSVLKMIQSINRETKCFHMMAAGVCLLLRMSAKLMHSNLSPLKAAMREVANVMHSIMNVPISRVNQPFPPPLHVRMSNVHPCPTRSYAIEVIHLFPPATPYSMLEVLLTIKC